VASRYPEWVRCPTCGSTDTRVIDSRPAEGGAAIRRRRVCASCDYRFTTYERGEPQLLIRKRNGRLEPFQPDKLSRGVAAALADRPVPSTKVSELIDEVEVEIRGQGSPVPSEFIGRLVLDGLRRIDEVAYLRFASVYKDFQGAADFEKEMAALEGEAH
jgi:transcriptional repressor NrdR